MPLSNPLKTAFVGGTDLSLSLVAHCRGSTVDANKPTEYLDIIMSSPLPARDTTSAFDSPTFNLDMSIRVDQPVGSM